MHEDQIERVILDYINGRLLAGQAADLTSATPLFQYGILDSFALFNLLAFITREFKIPLPMEQLRTEDFENVSTIVGFVRDRLAARPLAV